MVSRQLVRIRPYSEDVPVEILIVRSSTKNAGIANIVNVNFWNWLAVFDTLL